METTAVGWNGQLSLVESGGVVELVHWVSGREGALGRRLRLDNRNRVVWAIPGITPTRDFSQQTIIHPAVGTQAFKERGRDRPTLAADVMRLRSMWSCALAHGQGGHRPLMTCAHCPTPGDFECPCCLLSWHRACCADVAAKTRTRRDLTIDDFLFPALFFESDCLCNLCMQGISASAASGSRC